MSETVLVFDDDVKTAQEWVKALRNLDVFSGFFKAEVMQQQCISDLQTRYERFSEQKQWYDHEINLDRASVLVIDFRLGALTTGDDLAYLVRCFSKCPIIVGVNQSGENPFDLTLNGHLESFCDLNIGAKQLANPGLWSSNWDGFRPWSWPVLPDFLSKSKVRAEEVRKDPGGKVADVLGIGDEALYLPRSVRGFLGRRAANTTLKDFVLGSGNGLQAKDGKLYDPRFFDDDFLARIASARLSKWMETRLLSGQDTLVDAPHLVMRAPSLLRGPTADKAVWDRTAGFGALDTLGIKHEKIDEFRYRKDAWLSRPAWFWRKLYDRIRISEESEGSGRRRAGFVFCENTSRFMERSSVQVKQFFANVDSPFVRRFVEDAFDDVDYKPRVNFYLPDEAIETGS